MKSLREKQLADGLKNRLLGIQSSEQIFKGFAKLKSKTQTMSMKEVEKIADLIASKVEKYAVNVKNKTGADPTPQQIKDKVSKELGKI